MGLIVRRGQVRGLRMCMVVLVGLVVGTVGIESALVERRVAWRWGDVGVMMRGQSMVVILQDRLPSPHQADAAPWLAPSTTVQACGVHASESTTGQEAGRLGRQGKSPTS